VRIGNAVLEVKTHPFPFYNQVVNVTAHTDCDFFVLPDSTTKIIQNICILAWYFEL